MIIAYKKNNFNRRLFFKSVLLLGGISLSSGLYRNPILEGKKFPESIPL